MTLNINCYPVQPLLGLHSLRRLKTIREGKKLTQEYVAFRSGIAYSTVNNLENGRLNPTIATLFAISETLKIDVKELFD